MKQKLFFLLMLFSALAWNLSAQLSIIATVPDNTPDGATLYIAGSFNGWEEDNASYALNELGNGTYTITFSPAPGLLEFKFTRGSWATVEGNEFGGFLPNRTFNYSGVATTLNLDIHSWEDLGSTGGNTTATYNVDVVDEDFFIPQLNRNRRIWIYLPPDYNSSNKYYPVLYMHDGQNLFDAYTSAFGEWEVDESLNELFGNGDDGIIVVGIDNGGANRLNEYSPWVNPSYGGGEGDEYIAFIVENLKPYIDQNYRTRPQRDYTGIMGSSMGGLISLYAVIEYQDVFSKAGIFSASFWFSDECYQHVSATGKEMDTKFYLIAGQQEGSGGGQVADMNAMYNTLLGAGFDSDEVIAIAHADGQHSEWYWRREFPDGYEWLYSDANATDTRHVTPNMAIRLYPNPVNGLLQLEFAQMPGSLQYDVRDLNGAVVREKSAFVQQGISMTGLPSAYYIVSLYDGDGLWYCQKVLVR